MSVKVTVKNSGSIHIESENIELYDQDGGKYDLAGRTLIKLCRCGQSKDMPFCDSTHKTIGFSAPCAARTLPPPVPKV